MTPAPRSKGDGKSDLVAKESSDEARKLRQDIADTRAHMSGTIDELHGKLNPHVLKEQALAEFHELKQTITTELKEAKDSMKAEMKADLEEASAKVREATIGKVEKMVHDVERTAKDTTSSIFDTIRANPIPAALAGVGLAWLAMSATGNRRRRYDDRIGVRDIGDRLPYDRGYDDRGYADRGYGDRAYGIGGLREGGGIVDRASDKVDQASGKASEFAQTIRDKATDVVHEAADVARGLGDKADDVMQRAGDVAGRARSRMNETGHLVSDRMSDYAHRAVDRGRRVESDAGRFFEDNPLVVGAAMMAVGAAIGMAIPITRKESEFLGEYRDDALNRAKRLASGALGKVEQSVQRVADDLSKGGKTGGNENREKGEFAPDVSAVADRMKSSLAGGGDIYSGGSSGSGGDLYKSDLSDRSSSSYSAGKSSTSTSSSSGGPGSTTGADKGMGSLGSGTQGGTSAGIGGGSTPYGGGQKTGGTTPFSGGEPPIISPPRK